jgi:hypothetical protein
MSERGLGFGRPLICLVSGASRIDGPEDQKARCAGVTSCLDPDCSRCRRTSPGQTRLAVWPTKDKLRARSMLSNMQLTGFKAFKELDIELRPLTLLLGPNNTGKSSVISPIRLLAQTLTSGDPSVALLLDGPFGDFGTFRDVVNGNKLSSTFRIGLTGTPRMSPPDSSDSWHLDATFGYRSRRRQLILSEVQISDQGGHVLTATYVPESDRHVISKVRGKDVPSKYRGTSYRILRFINFLPYITIYRARPKMESLLGGMLSIEEWMEVDDRVDEIIFSAREQLTSAEYIGARRVPPERTYHQTGEGRARIGAAGENWTGMLVLDSSRGGGGSRRMRGQLGDWLRRAGLASEVRLHWLSDRHYEIQIRHPISREVENLADVGQGNSQVIPVLLGGLRLNVGDLYMVEEPEIHLHPHAQAELGDFFASLCRAGVNSLVETHSEYLVLRIQQRVAAGDISPNDVAFYYTEATKTGRKRVRKLTLDAHARFEQPIDGGFFPQKLDEARKLARLRA